MDPFQPDNPRIKFWSDQSDWPSDSKDYVFAGRAILQLGRTIFGDAWNDSIPATRYIASLPESLSLHMSLTELQRGVRLLLSTDTAYKVRNPPTGLLLEALIPTTRSPFPTAEEWEEAVSLAKTAETQSWRALAPFIRIGARLATACRDATVKTALRPPAGGEPIEQPWHIWNSEDPWLRFHTCRIDPDNAFSREQSPDGGWWIFVHRETFEQFKASQDTKAVTTTQDLTALEEAKQRVSRRRRGRPAEYNWAEFDWEAHARLLTNGVPKSRRPFASEMLEWCEVNWGKQPAESEVRRRLDVIIDAMPRDGR